jgi:general secretion pathway protein N
MTGQRIATYAAVAVFVYAAALVATIPAAWVSLAIAKVSGEKLQLRGPEGTLWSGNGRLYASPRAGPLLDLGRLRWRTAHDSVLGAKLVIEATLGDAPRALQIRLAPSSASIRGMDLTLPAEIIAAFAPAVEALGPAGVLRVHSDDLRFEGSLILGLAELEWRQIRLARAPGLDLGSQLARLKGGSSGLDIELSTLDGPLRLSGRGTWSRAAGLQLSGEIDQDNPQMTSLAVFLKGICTEYRGGHCRFHIRQGPNMLPAARAAPSATRPSAGS